MERNDRGKALEYRYLTYHAGAFIQQLVCYLRDGYHFYTLHQLRKDADPASADEQILSRYAIRKSKDQRYRHRKRTGEAALHYLRCGRTYLICATEGPHLFRIREARSIRDARRVPVKAFGHALRARRGGGVLVRIDEEVYRREKQYFHERACRASRDQLIAEFRGLPYEPYRKVLKQLFSLLRHVNRLRRQRGLATLPEDCVRQKRNVYRPFEPPHEGAVAA